MKSFNINDCVKFKLTDYGKDVYYHRFDSLNELAGKEVVKPSYPKIDSEGYSEMQLWHFMSIFGSHIFNGGPLVIENNRIYIRDEDLKGE